MQAYVILVDSALLSSLPKAVCTHHFHHTRHRLLSFINLTIQFEEYKLCSSSLCSFLQPLVTTSVVGCVVGWMVVLAMVVVVVVVAAEAVTVVAELVVSERAEVVSLVSAVVVVVVAVVVVVVVMVVVGVVMVMVVVVYEVLAVVVLVLLLQLNLSITTFKIR
jgi:hypothetical protein